jgi:hypothetical protein
MRCECVPSAEVCDGRDNDCDGAIDEDLANCPCASAGLARCGTSCVDTSNDRANCGACGTTCGPSSACQGGRCTTAQLDLLIVIDNSNTMRENQTNLLQQVSSHVTTLVSPPCVSRSNPVPHSCNPRDTSDSPQYPPIGDMHVGVVSTDLGTPGSSVPGCANSDEGDDGLLNPIRNGRALQRHEPWTSAPPTFGRPSDCTDPNQFPSFISFRSDGDPNAFVHDFECNAGLYVNGCGLESQLEAMYRALVIHDASDRAGNTSPNAGFLRESALLGIVMLTDEEDGSVRDCRYANGTPCDGVGAIDVYNPASTAWASMELNLRFYMYEPCGPQDPTWPLSRYIDPSNANAGLLGLKPGHPERILFSAITGVPNAIPTEVVGGTTRVRWDRLLGTPGPGGREDFCGRDSSGLGNLMSNEGPVSMAQAHADLACSQRVVPACRREGSPFDPTACTADRQYFAWPARRIVEVARRFDESPLCHGAPCRNGTIASICASNYAIAIAPIVARLH